VSSAVEVRFSLVWMVVTARVKRWKTRIAGESSQDVSTLTSRFETQTRARLIPTPYPRNKANY
jgi:hypothetical protein